MTAKDADAATGALFVGRLQPTSQVVAYGALMVLAMQCLFIPFVSPWAAVQVGGLSGVAGGVLVTLARARVVCYPMWIEVRNFWRVWSLPWVELGAVENVSGLVLVTSRQPYRPRRLRMASGLPSLIEVRPSTMFCVAN